MLGWLGVFFGSALSAPLQIAMLGLLGAAAFVASVVPDLPNVEALKSVQLREPLQVYSADGALIAEFGVERRRPVSISRVPPLVIDAFLATEDSRFFEHSGVDAIGMGRAIVSYLTTGEKAQGASTITMQVARNFFLTPEKTFGRKLKEILLTLDIERALSKQEILELYLNQIFFGHRSYGIAAAASLYYDKPLDKLTVAEAAMLAGVPKAPSSNNPVSNPPRALARRNYIVGRMYELGYINAEQRDTALATPDRASLHRRQSELDAGYVGEMARAEIAKFYGEDALYQGLKVTTTVESWLQNSAQEAVRSSLRQYDLRHGYRGPEARVKVDGMSDEAMDEYLRGVVSVPALEPALVTRVTNSGAEVYLGSGERITLKSSALAWAKRSRNRSNWRGPKRKASDTVLAGDLVRLRKTKNGSWVLSQVPRVSGSVVSISPRDGAVLALVGGYSFSKTKFNRAVDMRRQPGSSFKPFIYAAALHEGWTPASLVKDSAVRLPRREKWNPQNFDHKEMGPITMRRAIALSRNLAAINTLQSVGLSDAQTFIRHFGFDKEAMPAGLSMALGSGVLSPVKLAEGYAVFANGGYHVIPYFIKRIEDAEGKVIFEADPPQACSDCWFKVGQASAKTEGTTPKTEAELIIDPRIAYQMNSLLRDVVERGTGTRAKRLGRSDIVGKTGTSNDVRDSWFAGYQANYVTVAWMGFDDFSKLGRGEEGGKAAILMWVDFMRDALKGQPIAKLDPPKGMVKIAVTEKGKGKRTEYIAEEAQESVNGPEDVKVASSAPAPRPKKKSTTAKRSAPRVMDDLF